MPFNGIVFLQSFMNICQLFKIWNMHSAHMDNVVIS
jgi:hypothetical protein